MALVVPGMVEERVLEVLCKRCGQKKPDSSFYRKIMCSSCWTRRKKRKEAVRETPFETIQDVQKVAVELMGKEGPARDAAVVFLSSMIVGTGIERLMKFTSLPEATIRSVDKNLRHAGIWAGENLLDLDELMKYAKKKDDATMSVILSLFGLCGANAVVRRKNAEGVSMWSLEPSFRKALEASKQ